MIRQDHWQLSDEEFERQFERFTFKPTLFSHVAHLRLAYIHIQKYGAQQAEQNMVDQIKNYADYYGAKDKFNKTVTIAAVKTIQHFMTKSATSSFQDLITEFPQLANSFRDLLAKHYSFNIFSDPEAKKEFIQPDLRSF